MSELWYIHTEEYTAIKTNEVQQLQQDKWNLEI